jgi:hypothetical protein
MPDSRLGRRGVKLSVGSSSRTRTSSSMTQPDPRSFHQILPATSRRAVASKRAPVRMSPMARAFTSGSTRTKVRSSMVMPSRWSLRRWRRRLGRRLGQHGLAVELAVSGLVFTAAAPQQASDEPRGRSACSAMR